MLIYEMLNSGDNSHFCYAFHNMQITAHEEPFAVFDGMPVPAAVILEKETSRLQLALFYPLMKQLTQAAQIEILKHEAIHVLDGHMSMYGLEITKRFGNIVANLAMDCYVNQRINTKAISDAGLILATTEMFGLEDGLTSVEYAQQLSQRDDILEPGSLITADDEGFADAATGAEGNFGKDRLSVSEVFDLNEANVSQASHASRSVISNVESTMSARNLKARGLHGADHAEFVKALQRDATVPWFQFLRQMESGKRRDFSVPTRRRPSRRHVAYFGRIRRFGLDATFMVDTSMSMGADALSMVDPELRGLHYRGARVRVIHCDAGVAKIEDYNPFSTLSQFHGRGGTDFSPAILCLRELDPSPAFFVGFTDGYGSVQSYVQEVIKERGQGWFDSYLETQPTVNPDGIETLWLLPEGEMSPDDFKEQICPWGTVAVVPRPAK